MRNYRLGASIFLFVTTHAFASNDYISSVAQVRVVSYSYSIDHPWQKGSGFKSSGSAVLIDDSQLLTNAHVIDSALRVELRRAGTEKWYRASIEHVSEASDLAVLKVEDKSFYDGSLPAQLSSDTNFGAEVFVVGFPEGGDSVSITQGVLSRTEETQYAYSYMSHMAYQIDAAVNSGNSGGAVFSNDNLVGISFQTNNEAENVGFAIPASVIEQFIADTADGVVNGVPQLPFAYWPITNPNMRAYLGVSGEYGAYISETTGDIGADCVRKGDAIIAINGRKVSTTGKVDIPSVGNVSIDYLASIHQVGDVLELSLIRDGQNHQAQCKLKYNWNNLWGAAGISSQYRPNWMEIGGIILVDMAEEVFTFMEENDIEVDEAATSYRHGLQRGQPNQPEGAVWVSNILDHDANLGYDLIYSTLKSVNGESVTSLNSVKDIMAKTSGPWLVLEFHNGGIAVFMRSDLEMITQDLSVEYGL